MVNPIGPLSRGAFQISTRTIEKIGTKVANLPGVINYSGQAILGQGHHPLTAAPGLATSNISLRVQWFGSAMDLPYSFAEMRVGIDVLPEFKTTFFKAALDGLSAVGDFGSLGITYLRPGSAHRFNPHKFPIFSGTLLFEEASLHFSLKMEATDFGQYWSDFIEEFVGATNTLLNAMVSQGLIGENDGQVDLDIADFRETQPEIYPEEFAVGGGWIRGSWGSLQDDD